MGRAIERPSDMLRHKGHTLRDRRSPSLVCGDTTAPEALLVMDRAANSNHIEKYLVPGAPLRKGADRERPLSGQTGGTEASWDHLRHHRRARPNAADFVPAWRLPNPTESIC